MYMATFDLMLRSQAQIRVDIKENLISNFTQIERVKAMYLKNESTKLLGKTKMRLENIGNEIR